MLHPSYTAKGDALYGDGDLRFVKHDNSLNADARFNLLRTGQVNLRIHVAAIVGTVGEVLACLVAVVATALVIARLGGLHLELVVLMFLFSIGALLGTVVIQRNIHAIRHEHRIREALPDWFAGEAIPLSDPRMRRLIQGFGSDWNSVRTQMLQHGSTMGNILNGVVDIYLATFDALNNQFKSGVIDEDDFAKELSFAVQTARHRYSEMSEDWSWAMKELYLLSRNAAR